MRKRDATTSVVLSCKARRWAVILGATVLGLALVAGLLALTGSLPALAAADPLQAAWEKARHAGSYHFEAEVRQETIPVASPANVGLSGQADVYFMIGDAEPPNRLWAKLWQGEGSVARDDLASELLMRDGQVYLRQRPGAAWRKQDNPLQLTAPSGDYLNFFQAAEAVTFQGYETAGGQRYARYSFQLDGARYAELLEDQLNRELADQVAGGVEFRVPASVRQTGGEGTAWLTEDGLPARMTLDLRVPGADDRYRVRGNLRIDFSGFGDAPPVPADAPPQPAAGLTIPLPKFHTEQNARGGLPNPPHSTGFDNRSTEAHGRPEGASVVVVPWSSLVAAFFLALTIQAVRHGGRKKIYALLALMVIVSMVLSPLLRSVHLDRFFRAREAQAAAGPSQLQKLAQSPIFEGLMPRPAAYDDVEPPTLTELVQTEGIPLPDDGRGAYDVVPYAPPPSMPLADSGEDTDGDGLSDDYEIHVGTDPLEPDSDFDGITDDLEVLGFSYKGQMWYSNPAHPDSNADGLADKIEWTYPSESAPAYDADGDGTPNLWDEDDDADGVPDRADLSPYSLSDWIDQDGYGSGQYFSVRASKSYPVYVNVQLRPQNEAHLRYAMKSLDWPYDIDGNMKDHNNSHQDLTLVPYLQILDVSYIPPSLQESNPYGIMVDRASNHLYVPLSPVTVGGKVVAFDAKLFVDADPNVGEYEIAGTMHLVWMVHGKVDTKKDDGTWTYDQDTVLTVYGNDPFRITGMNASEQKNADAAAIYIHPNANPASDGPLHQAINALSAGFLSYSTFSLTQMTSAQFATWGITTTARPADTLLVTQLDYDHEDELLAQMTMTTTKNTLSNYSTAITPTILFAYEHQGRLQSLAEVNTSGVITAANFVFDLPSVHDSTERGVTLHKYRHTDGEWEVLPTDALLGEIERLYVDDPEVDDELLDLLKLWYLVWNSGQSAVIKIGGVSLPASGLESPDDDYFYKAAKLVKDSKGLVKRIFKDSAVKDKSLPGKKIKEAVKDRGKAVWEKFKTWLKGGTRWFRIAVVVVVAVLVVGILIWAFGASRLWKAGQWAWQLYSVYDHILKLLDKITLLVKAARSAKSAGDFVKNLFKSSSMSLLKLTKATMILTLIFALIEVALIWYAFFSQSDALGGPGAVAYNMAMASATGATVVAMLFLALSVTVVGFLLVLIIGIIDGILWLCGVDWSISGWLSEAIADALTDIEPLAEIDTDSVTFDSFTTELWDPARGLQVGNRIYFKSTIRSEVLGTHKEGVEKTMLMVGLEPQSEGYGDPSAPYLADGNGYDFPNCTRPGWAGKRCWQPVQLSVYPRVATRDLKIPFRTAAYYRVLLEQCNYLFGIRFIENCSTGLWYPDEPAYGDWNDIYLDIFPESLDELWNWGLATGDSSYPFNPDQDGDGLNDVSGGDPDKTRWDTDGDGLSDRLENSRSDLNPQKADTDDDGLNDADELRYGTLPNRWDSDNDGLSDYLEVQGWTLSFGGAYTATRAFPDPLQADADGDDLNDLEEWKLGTNPNAYNLVRAPVVMNVEPDLTTKGRTVIYTLRLRNQADGDFSSLALTATLPAEVSVVQVSPDGTVAITQTGTSPYSWAVADMSPGDQITIALRGAIDSGVSSSRVANAQVQGYTVYAAEVYTADLTIPLEIDVDPPQSSVIPQEVGTYLRGSSYVLGGSAIDNMAWVERVEVSTDNGGTWHDVELQAQGQNVTWAWLWEWSLPGDGAYTIRSRSADSLGNVETPGSGEVYYIDNTPPTASIGNLSNGDAISIPIADLYNNAVLTVTGIAEDNLSGVKRVVVNADDKEYEAGVASEGSTSTAWTLGWRMPNPRFQTSHTLQVLAWDVAGNEGDYSTLITVTVDNRSPTSDMPPLPAFITGPLLLTGTAAEQHDDYETWAVAGLEKVQVGYEHLGSTSQVTPTDLSGVTWSDATLGESGFFTTTTWTTTLTPAQDGFYAIFVRAADVAGNGEDPEDEGTLYRGLIYADITSPTVAISSPQTGLVTNRPVIEVEMTATDPPYGGSVESVELGVTFEGSTTWYTQTSYCDDTWYYSWEPSADGVYTLTARAADGVGWVGYSSETVTVTLATAAPLAGISYPADGGVVSGTQVFVQGSARSAPATTVETVTLQISGGGPYYATLLDSGSVVNWVYTWTPAAQGEWVLGAYAVDSLYNVQTETVAITVTYDNSSPGLTVESPPAGTVVTATTYELITGTVWDMTTDVRAVKIITGTGGTWQVVTDVVSAGVFYNWTYTWTLQTEDWVTHTVTVGGWDLAGNQVTTTRIITVDNVPPRSIDVLTATLQSAGKVISTSYWITGSDALNFIWDEPYDGGGIAGYSYMWDNITDTLPDETPFLFSESINQGVFDDGVWYLHLRTFDNAGHNLTQHFGPWYVDKENTPSFDNGDGVVGLADNEHIEDEELLGTDNRSGQGGQSFYVTWDAEEGHDNVLYIAWQGARWNGGGDLFVYLDVDTSLPPGPDPDGTTIGYSYGYTQTYTLPFKADYVLWVEDGETWGLKEWSGSAWVTATLPTTATLAHNASAAGTEIHLPMSAINLDPRGWPEPTLRMIAIATEESSPEAWAVFPNTNYLGTFTLADHFTWGELGAFATIQKPAEWQPKATNLTLDVGIAPSDLEPIQHGSLITYVINYRNDGLQPVPWVKITATVANDDPLHGLSWLSWEHSDPDFDQSAANCASGATTCMWWVGQSSELGEALAVSATGTITLVGQVQMMPVTTLDAVTATILLYAVNVDQQLADSTPDDNTVTSVHAADNEPPEVNLGGTSVAGAGIGIADASGGYVSPGTATIGGTASDDKAGVTSVEIKVGSGDWQPATGCTFWSTTINTPQNSGDKVTVYARGTDRLRRVSDATSFEYTVDATTPVVTLTNLSNGQAITDAYTIRGTASDSYPGGGEITSVDVSQDGTNWNPVDIWRSDGSGGYTWSWRWPLAAEDGESHTLWVRSRDAVDNLTATPEQVSFVVDTLIPESSITSPSNGAIISGSTVLQGTADDGSGIRQVEVSTDGGDTWHAATGTTNWSYIWQPETTGSYTLKSRATDIYGNVELAGEGVQVTVSDVAYEIYLPIVMRYHSSSPSPAPPWDARVYLPIIFK